ncbi:MAG: hypothetical protein B6245_01375 [Desulfobacteraceae bacterium 4572_88]|nr:MAG: hypothetical protein B6245_01375 [Desulfobacteraceae bacterium 4572_88]
MYVREGVYKENITVNVSGSENGGYVTFRNYQGETPVLDGTGLTVPMCHRASSMIADQSYIVIQHVKRMQFFIHS